MERYVCIHCHFYQPPRENPWLEAVELQDSAYPYHDWNERIAAECYVPNSASRILNAQGRIAKIVNNYARISFNFGPTLLSWMEENAPRAYELIQEADRQSCERFSGHGAALAQAYNHIILPLANARDKYTQIVWGITDFQSRFGRDPEGMWLPETAVDQETLYFLSSLGIKFTILAPHQARQVRSHLWQEWSSVEGARIDPTRAYRCWLPGGRSINLFFYDGPISRAVAFESLLSNGEQFAKRLLSGFNEQRPWAQLMHIATDGETYGHHHARGDMALAYALDYIESGGYACLTNYGEYLEAHPPTEEVAIIEHTSWSCCHGTTRWESDCGCNSGGYQHWSQQWRWPLRQALNWLRDELAGAFEFHAPEVLRDPWAARNDYIRLVLERSPARVNAFLAQHAAGDLDQEQRIRALKLLEMQRQLMLMFTSCGWFFDELSGLETVQVLQYASRALQLAEQLFGGEFEEQFLQRLEQAWSNISGLGNGRQVYQRFVRPARVDLLGVGAHYVISSLFEVPRARDSVHCYDVDLRQWRMLESGRAKLAVGCARLKSRITLEEMTATFGVVHLGDHNVCAGIHPMQSEHEFYAVLDEATRAFKCADLPECVRIIDRRFNGATYSLKSLFRDEQRDIINQIVGATMAEAQVLYSQVYENHAPLITFLNDANVPLPPVLRVTAEFALSGAVQQALRNPQVELERIRTLLESASRDRINLNPPEVEAAMCERLNALVDQWAVKPRNLQLLSAIESLVSLTRILPFEVNLWQSQNVYYELTQAISEEAVLRMGRNSAAWIDHFLGLGNQLGVDAQPAAAPAHCLPGHVAARANRKESSEGSVAAVSVARQ